MPNKMFLKEPCIDLKGCSFYPSLYCPQTNLDNILKSRDITLPTKVHRVKAVVFPVVMYGCDSWIIKKLSAKELMLWNCGVGESLQVHNHMPTSP